METLTLYAEVGICEADLMLVFIPYLAFSLKNMKKEADFDQILVINQVASQVPSHVLYHQNLWLGLG